jgi:ADP-dependent NAD(P)H-hydrate dehydratase
MPKSEHQTVTTGLLRDWPLPAVGSSKDERGVVLIVGGSTQTVGAVVLAAEAALRVGAGKVQIATVESRAGTLAVAMPEALVRPLAETADGHLPASVATDLADLAKDADVVLIGPGMAGETETRALVEALLPLVRGRLVLDALGLSVVTPTSGALRAGREPAVLTPNLHELAITLGTEDVAADVAGAARMLAARTGAVVHAGGDDSITATRDQLWTDDTGPRGLAIAGSGDVLAGTIAGLLARGAAPDQAAVWGAHLHAEAGNRLAARIGPVGYLAREIVKELPEALRHIGEAQ